MGAIPRLIPEKRWYATPPVLIALGGILPFGSIFIEMYFVFTSFWNYKFYYVYGFMLLVYIILTIVTVCVTIVVTYFLLNNEDYRCRGRPSAHRRRLRAMCSCTRSITSSSRRRCRDFFRSCSTSRTWRYSASRSGRCAEPWATAVALPSSGESTQTRVSRER